MGKRILVVDDSSMMRKMIVKSLSTSGHQVLGEAKNGREALDLYRSLSPDVVTMDITMREMDGMEAARAILGQDRDAKIIFVSNLDAEKYGAIAQEIGAKGYVSKHQQEELLKLLDSL